MREITDYFLTHESGSVEKPKTMANIFLEKYVRYFSRDLAYYDPVLPEEKKREAAQALISALQARPCVAPPENHLGEQSYPLIAIGSYYLLSPWRHRSEVIEYIKSVEFTDRVTANEAMVEELMLPHHNVIREVRYVPAHPPKPGIAFPVHPVAKARAEAAAQMEKDQTHASPSPNTVPGPALAPPPPPPAVSVPSSVPAAPSTKTSRAVWWILGTFVALGAVVFINRRNKQ
jgi:hypothetical protein